MVANFIVGDQILGDEHNASAYHIRAELTAIS